MTTLAEFIATISLWDQLPEWKLVELLKEMDVIQCS